MNTSKLPLVGKLIDRLKRRSDHEAIKAALQSKGDVTKMVDYQKMSDCLSALSNLENGSGSMGKPLRVARQTRDTLLKNRGSFTKAFHAGGSEGTQYVYASATAALWHTVSLMCAEGVTFVQGDSGRYSPMANKVGIDGMSGSVMITRLERFNDAAGKYGFEQTITEAAQLAERSDLHESIGGIIGMSVAVVMGLVALLYIARDLAEKFYSLRGTFSRWLDVQAAFLELNASVIGAGRPEARATQEARASKFRALADRIRVDDDDTEQQANRAIQHDDQQIEAEGRRSAPTELSTAGAGYLL